jgi:hypothetical protein
LRAAGLYEKLGSRRVFAVDVFPHGIVRFTMLRDAGANDPSPA